MRFAYINQFESGTLTAADRYTSTYDVANLIDRRLAKKYRSAAITNLMTYGDCEETTSPTLDGGTFGLADATWARSAVEVQEGTYSWLFTKTSAAAAGDAENWLTDNVDTTDLHNLIAGRTYGLKLWMYTDVAVLANANVVVQEYHTAAWHDILTLQATGASAWEALAGSFTINVLSTAVTIKLFIDTSEVAGKLMYIDDIRFYLENRIFHDAGTGLTNNPTIGYIAAHNLSSAAVVRIQGNATAEWTSPTVDELVTYSDAIMYEFFTGSALRYWSILFDDEDNPDGYIQVGYASLGTYLQATKGPARVFGENPDDKSLVMEGASGQVVGSTGVLLKEWELNIPWWTDTMKTAFETMYDVVRIYKPFLFVLDENNTAYFPPKYARITNYKFTHIMKLQSWSATITMREAK
jgi:hypothetical protein